MPDQTVSASRAVRRELYLTPGTIFFFTVHLACLSVWWVGTDWLAVAMCAGFFLIRKFGITAGFHRYFSHRSYKTTRGMQFCLAVLGGMAAQKGVLWWASHHRYHHRHSDTEEDLHSAKFQGFLWSHAGWALSRNYHSYDPSTVKDLIIFPELVWIDRWYFLPPVALGVLCLAIHGWMGVVWGFCISTVVLYHTTFAINSLCHLFGNQRFQTGDLSRNSWWLALLTLGEGWHNNHHHYPVSCRQGFFWWEIDITYYALKVLSCFGLVWDLRAPPPGVIQAVSRGKLSWL